MPQENTRVLLPHRRVLQPIQEQWECFACASVHTISSEMIGGPESNICDKYMDLIQLHGSPTWKTTVQKLYQYLSSQIAENSFPTWLPSNCSSALKQLVRSSLFEDRSQDST